MLKFAPNTRQQKDRLRLRPWLSMTLISTNLLTYAPFITNCRISFKTTTPLNIFVRRAFQKKPTKFWTYMSNLWVGWVFLSHTSSKKKVWTKTFEVCRSGMDVNTYCTKVWWVPNMVMVGILWLWFGNIFFWSYPQREPWFLGKSS